MAHQILRMTGRCRSADGSTPEAGGSHYHAVPIARVSGGGSWAKALCGKTPGRRGNGWSDYPGTQVTCPKCLARLAKIKE